MDNIRRFNIIDGYDQTLIEIDGDDGEFCVYSDIAPIIAERDAAVKFAEECNDKRNQAVALAAILEEMVEDLKNELLEWKERDS